MGLNIATGELVCATRPEPGRLDGSSLDVARSESVTKPLVRRLTRGLVVVADYFVDDKAQKLLAERGVEAC